MRRAVEWRAFDRLDWCALLIPAQIIRILARPGLSEPMRRPHPIFDSAASSEPATGPEQRLAGGHSGRKAVHGACCGARLVTASLRWFAALGRYEPGADCAETFLVERACTAS